MFEAGGLLCIIVGVGETNKRAYSTPERLFLVAANYYSTTSRRSREEV